MKADEDIFTQFRSGRLETFYSTVYPGLIVWAARILGTGLAFLAEDCVQDAVFETYTNAASLRNATHWRVFLYTCVRNRAISLCRRQTTHNDYASMAGDEVHADSIETVMIEHEVIEALAQVIDTLDDRERELFRLHFELGMRGCDIAERLGLAEITVKKQKARLLATLRQRLKGKVPPTAIALILSAL